MNSLKRKRKKNIKQIRQKIKKILQLVYINVKNFFIKYGYLIILATPFIVMDIITRMFGKNINFSSEYKLFPAYLFTLCWVILFVGLTIGFRKRIGKFFYLFFCVIYLVIFLLNNVYYSLTRTFFDFSLLESASEGSPYIIDTIKNCNPMVYVATLFIIILIYIAVKYIPYKTKNNNYLIGGIILIFLIFHSVIPYTLGKANSDLTWSSWKNPRNIYNSFNDSNKAIKVSGLFEYAARNFYVTFLKTKEQEKVEDIEFLKDAFADSEISSNSYTGLFRDKNLIFIQFEGLDDWLITKDDTPTIYGMLNNSFVFNNHYSYYNGGGSTFNSEFAVNTGFITPLSYTQNAYTFNKNSFPYSMANLFKDKGYIVNAFHMNNGEYYSRTANYKNWGYDNYYGLLDIEKYADEMYKLDRELILNENFNNLIFRTDEKFVDYIITYTGHMPFTNTKGTCKLLYNLDIAENEENDNEIILELDGTIEEEIKEENEFKQMSEEECIRRQAKETDYMMELLLTNLEEKGLLDNTVIVAFSDHYLYTIEDKTILDKYKITGNNLINKTPLFIWSNGIKKTNINHVTSQLNILPTVLNLFGMDYNPNNYIGTDALNPKYQGIVFFSDYSWYDGNVYVVNGEVANDKSISYDKLEEKNYHITNITKKNDLALKFNYFKTIK